MTGFMERDPGIDVASERLYPTPYATSALLPLLLMSLASQRHAPKTKTHFREEYDYIIVGAGSAGSVVASRLTETPCVSVLLLEAGKSPPRLTEVPGLARNMLFTDIDWSYKTAPLKHTAACHVNRSIPWPSGKTLGGSSTLNAMLNVRGNRKNYDNWATQGATGWSYQEVLPYFIRLEDNVDQDYLQNGYHGTGGPITTGRPKFNPRVRSATIDTLMQMGYHFVDPNGPTQTGFYDLQATIRRGQRCSTAKAYLVPGEDRPNLDIVANAMARKVLIENKQAKGVEFDFQGYTYHVRARREVILSAGTTNTAQLLMLSGIGPMSELSKFGIPLVADLPVGRNLQDHPATFIPYEVSNKLPSFEEELSDETNVRKYINSRTGPLTSTEGINLMSFLPNYGGRPGSDIPDHSVYFIDFVSLVPLYQLGLYPDVIATIFGPYMNKTKLTCCSQLLRPRSVGTVTLQSTNPYDPPVIDPNYLEDYRDVDDLVQGLKRCNRIMMHPNMKKIGARPFQTLIPGCEEFAQDEYLYLRCLVRSVIFTTNHQVGTAKMGDPRDPTTVVDPQLRVKNVKNLRVVDASIMPSIPWGNTNVPTIMIAEKASDMIKRTIRCSHVPQAYSGSPDAGPLLHHAGDLDPHSEDSGDKPVPHADHNSPQPQGDEHAGLQPTNPEDSYPGYEGETDSKYQGGGPVVQPGEIEPGLANEDPTYEEEDGPDQPEEKEQYSENEGPQFADQEARLYLAEDGPQISEIYNGEY